MFVNEKAHSKKKGFKNYLRDKTSSFNELLEKDNSISIHQKKNLQALQNKILDMQ